MPNGFVNPYVRTFNVKDDNTIALNVLIVGIAPGSWAEVSGYIIQNPDIFVPFSDVQLVPASAGGTPSVTVNVSAPQLNPALAAQVVTRVTEAKIWSTTLKIGPDQGAQQTWVAVTDGPGQQSGQPSPVPATDPAASPNPSFTWKDPSGNEYNLTVTPASK